MEASTVRDSRMRKWFPSEFTWRLYVVFQVATLIWVGVFVLDKIAKDFDKLLIYQPVYGQVDPAEIEEARARCAHLSDDPRDGREIDPLLSPYPPGSFEFQRQMSPQDRCLMDDMPKPSIVGQQYVGMNYDLVVTNVVGTVIMCLVAVVVPFALVRVPTWLWEGWRK